MKYLLTSLCLFYSLIIKAQISPIQKSPVSITIGKIAPMGAFVAELSYMKNEADEKDTTYILRFNNMKYKHIDAIESVYFSGTGGVVDDLYKAFKSVFNEENKKNKDYIIKFSLGKEVVAISNTKAMGVTSAMFLVKDAYFSLTEKQIDKLFGRK